MPQKSDSIQNAPAEHAKQPLQCPIEGRRYKNQKCLNFKISIDRMHIIACVYARWGKKMFPLSEVENMIRNMTTKGVISRIVPMNAITYSGYIRRADGRREWLVRTRVDRTFVLTFYALTYLHKCTEPTGEARDTLLAPEIFTKLVSNKGK